MKAALILILSIAAASTPATASPVAQPVAAESLAQGFVLVVQDKTGLAKADSPIYLASNAGGWNPGLPAMKLSGRSDGRWQIIVPRPAEGTKLEFKFTRGSWETVETASDGSDLPNRTLAPVDTSKLKPGEPPLIELTVATWADQRPGAQKSLDPYRTIQATGTVRRVQVVGGGLPKGEVRDLPVWLPPGYDDRANAQRTYQVLYLMDGQNIFEQLPGVPAEWRADETAADLIAKGQIEPLIIVGIPHAGQSRTPEYLPLQSFQGATTYGEPFVQWLLREVMPRIERGLRVKSGPDNTAIGGASLGGLISLYAATTHPDRFGMVLAESPSLVIGQGEAWKDLFGSVKQWPARIYLGMGDHEVPDAAVRARLVAAVQALDATIKAAGIPDAHRMLVIEAGAVHDENAWARRLPAAMKFLFGANP